MAVANNTTAVYRQGTALALLQHNNMFDVPKPHFGAVSALHIQARAVEQHNNPH